jgi:Leucine-rich repeat (LRR) protein
LAVEFERLQALEILELTLKLPDLPAGIGNLANLKELNLKSNQMTRLPGMIGNLHALKTLNVSFNKLTTLPAEIGNLGALTTLDVGFNTFLKALPKALGGLTELETLSVKNNFGLTVPPFDVVARGTKAILEFLRNLPE